MVLNAINRGFAGCIMWSPYFAAMALVLGRYELSWGGIVRVNLPLAIVALGGGFVVDCLRLPSGGFVVEGKLSAGSRRILLSMIGFGLLLTVVMLFIEAWVGLSMILIVSMMAVVVPAAWSFFPGNRDVYVRGVRQYFQQTLPLLRGEVVLFLCAGFFAAAVAQSEVGQYINVFLRQVNLYGQFVTVLMFIGVIVLLAVIGVHPVISVSVLTGIVRPGDLGMTTEGLAVTMLSSWAIANVSSPFTAVNMMLAGLSGKSSVLTGLRWNIKYSVVMSLVLGFCITVLF